MSLETRISNLLARAYNADNWQQDKLNGGLILWARHDLERRTLLAVRSPNGASETEAQIVTRDCGFPVHPPEKIVKSGYRGYKIREKTLSELEAERLATLETVAAGMVEAERAQALNSERMAGRSVNPRIALETDFVHRAMLEANFYLLEDVWSGEVGGWSAQAALEKFRKDASRAPKELLDWISDKNALRLYHFVF